MDAEGTVSPPVPMEVENINEGDGDDGEAMNEAMNETFLEDDEEIDDLELDCYPYTFSPLLLFAEQSYFDKGYSNFNSVAQFFSPILRNLDDPDDDIDMLHNVLYERKNMMYENLLNYIIDNEMLVTCCIDSHFTAFQMFKKQGKATLISYDPMSSSLQLATNDSAKKFALFKMMKCNYGDGQHIQDNKDHYTGGGTNVTRRTIYSIWKKIHQIDRLYDVTLKSIRLNLNRYVMFNARSEPTNMSTQLTGNTCYFQTYLHMRVLRASLTHCIDA